MYLGVCGWPVAHSRSPAMHNAALAAVGLLEWRYLALPLPPELFAETVRALPAAGFRGVNVTIPHKEAALELADRASDAAREIGAANTLTFERDGAIVYALKQAGAKEIRIWNRTKERAQALADEFGATTGDEPGEIIVNCTSIGLHDPSATFKALPLRADDLCVGRTVVDLVYRNGGTLLLNTAKANGAEVVDGLEILVAQGAASLERWTGRTAPDQAMREAVVDIAAP